MNLLDKNISISCILGKKSEKKKKKKKKPYNNMRCIVQDLIIGMLLLVKIGYIKKP